MGILNAQVGEVGLSGVVPNLIYINTNNTQAEVTAVGYLNPLRSQGFNITDYNMALVATRTTPSSRDVTACWYEVVRSGDNYSLQTINGTLPAVGASGTFIISNGSAWIASTLVLPNTIAINGMLYASSANTMAQLTPQNSAVLVSNLTGVPSWTASLTDGQIIIGDTSGTPTPATLTAGSGIGIDNAAGAITINSIGGGVTWTEVTGTSSALAINNGYIANNAGLVTLTLPATAVIGSVIRVQGKGAGLWRIAQNAGQTIHFGASDTTTGAAGYIEATQRYDSVELVCITADTDWAVLGAPQGSLTVN